MRVYLRARYYDPATGVFISRDPFEGTMTRPMSVNGYSWVEGNVVNATDPSGMSSCIQQEIIDLVPTLQPLGPVAPCPDSSHPLILGSDFTDTWVNLLRFCKIRGDGFRYKNENLPEIMDAITALYGFEFPQKADNVWSWNDLAGVGRGSWLIARAVDSLTGGFSDRLVRDALGSGTRVRLGFDGVIASTVDTFGSPAGIVPPPSFGGTGSTIHMRPGRSRPDILFIHEVGHVLDFRLGTTYSATDLSRNSNRPSSMLMQFAGGSYGSSLGMIYSNPIAWAVYITTNDDFDVGIFVSDYGGLNHYEYFAETWEAWVLQASGKIRNFTTLDSRLEDFINNNLLDFLNHATTAGRR